RGRPERISADRHVPRDVPVRADQDAGDRRERGPDVPGDARGHDGVDIGLTRERALVGTGAWNAEASSRQARIDQHGRSVAPRAGDHERHVARAEEVTDRAPRRFAACGLYVPLPFEITMPTDATVELATS